MIIVFKRHKSDFKEIYQSEFQKYLITASISSIRVINTFHYAIQYKTHEYNYLNEYKYSSSQSQTMVINSICHQYKTLNYRQLFVLNEFHSYLKESTTSIKVCFYTFAFIKQCIYFFLNKQLIIKKYEKQNRLILKILLRIICIASRSQITLV